MAIQPLEQRLNQMAMEGQTPPSIPVDENKIELEGLPPENAGSPAEFEPVQVAGLGEKIVGGVVSGAKAIAKKIAPKELEGTALESQTSRPLIAPEDKADKVGPYQVIREASEQEAKDVEVAQPYMPGGMTPSPTAAQLERGAVKGPINTDKITGPDELKQFIEAVGLKYGVYAESTMSFKDLTAKLSTPEYVLTYKGHEIGRFTDELEAKNAMVKEGLDREIADPKFNETDLDIQKQISYTESDLAAMVDPTAKTVADPKELYKLMLAVNDAGTVAFDLGKRVMAAKAAGTLTPELAMQFKQAIAVEGALIQGLKRKQVDVARSLGIFKMAREGSAERGAMMEQILNEAGGIESVHDMAKHYVALDSRAARRDMAAKTLSGSLKDIWISTWYNGILSAPQTHLINVASNFAFSAWQIPETYMAVGIGKLRNMMFGGEEAMILGEANARAFGLLQGLSDGWAIAAKAFIKNEPTDAFTKIETARGGREAFDIDFGDTAAGRAMNKGLRAWGSFVTLPGRTLMAEDEFFKAVGYRMELNGLAVRAGHERYAALLKQGLSMQEAKAQSAELIASIIRNPPKDIDDAARSAARTVTFTRELEPALQNIEKLRNLPGGIGLLLRLQMPFVRTPTNIALETLARTPLAAISPRFWSAFNKGGVERDKALARVTLGTIAGTVAAYNTFQGNMTGAGPFRLDDKKALEGTGWQPFSFVFDKKDVSPELLAKYQKMTKVSVGPDKVYVSYARMEPLSMLLSMGATTGEYAMAAPEGDYAAIVERGMMGLGVSMYEYMGNQPMLQGFSELTKIFQSQKQDGPGLIYDLMTKLGGSVAEFAVLGNPVGGPYSSLLAATTRVLNPEKPGLGPEEMFARDDIGAGVWNTWLTEVNRLASRNPFFSGRLETQLDSLTGEKLTISQGNMYELWSPWKTSDGKMPNGYEVLVKYQIPLYEPPKMINGVIITQAQRNRWIKLATGSELGATNPETGKKETLAQTLQRIGEDETVVRMWETPTRNAGRATVQGVLQNIISERYSQAREAMIHGSPVHKIQGDTALKDAIEAVAQERDIEGKYKR